MQTPPGCTLPPDADPPRYKPPTLDSDLLPLDADPLSLDAAVLCFQHKSLCHGLHGYQCNCSHMTTEKKPHCRQVRRTLNSNKFVKITKTQKTTFTCTVQCITVNGHKGPPVTDKQTRLKISHRRNKIPGPRLNEVSTACTEMFKVFQRKLRNIIIIYSARNLSKILLLRIC